MGLVWVLPMISVWFSSCLQEAARLACAYTRSQDWVTARGWRSGGEDASSQTSTNGTRPKNNSRAVVSFLSA